MTPGQLALAGLAALAAGIVNAVAGGGTLISFPMLIALGVPPVSANVTNTVALVPGYLGGVIAQRADLDRQDRRLRVLLPAAALGGLTGAALLLLTPERVFEVLVPVLILAAVGVLALGDAVKRRVAERISLAADGAPEHLVGPAVGVFLAAIYGGYFGGGLGIIVLAVLGVILVDTLTRLNALKQVTSLVVNAVAAGVFVLFGDVVWSAAAVMLVCAVVGGFLGGTLASRVPARVLQRIVLVIGVAVAIGYAVTMAT
ncbi:MAG: sulfite exporter TauE/SafE family protein [Actinobacteria bacterium]|nr:sulfite exporter TauE/SafE family protein [Actinomycetota bacterium]